MVYLDPGTAGLGAKVLRDWALGLNPEVRCSSIEPGLNSVMQAWTSTFVDPAEHLLETRAKLRLLLEHNADVHARIAHSGDTMYGNHA